MEHDGFGFRCWWPSSTHAGLLSSLAVQNEDDHDTLLRCNVLNWVFEDLGIIRPRLILTCAVNGWS